MERRFRFGYLNLAGGESEAPSTLLEPACEERLAAAVLAAHRLKNRAASPDESQLLVHRGLEPFETHGESVKASLRHGPTAKSIDDFLTALGAHHACQAP